MKDASFRGGGEIEGDGARREDGLQANWLLADWQARQGLRVPTSVGRNEGDGSRE